MPAGPGDADGVLGDADGVPGPVSPDREILHGGLRGHVERRGDTVIRSGHSRSAEHSHRVLRLLETAGWRGAPRLLEPGPPEVVSYVPGRVPARDEDAAWARAPQALEAVGRLIREFHDLTGESLAQGLHRVICHHDLAPANTVYDPDTGLPIAFIDWDAAAPGERAEDLGHAFWQWMRPGPDARVSDAREGLSALLGGYGGLVDRPAVVAAAIARQHATADGIESGAASDPDLAQLQRRGVPRQCRESGAWTQAHRNELAAAPAGAPPTTAAPSLVALWPLERGAIRIRPARLDDAPALHSYWSLPITQRYTDRAPSTLDQSREQLRRSLEDPQNLLCVIEHDDAVIGDIGGRFRVPHALDPHAFGAGTAVDFSLGYGLHPDHWGRGLATTAVSAFTARLHDELGVRRIVAMVFAENTASRRVLERNGYRLEGIEKAAVIGRDGRWLDDCTLAHLPEDPRRVG